MTLDTGRTSGEALTCPRQYPTRQGNPDNDRDSRRLCISPAHCAEPVRRPSNRGPAGRPGRDRPPPRLGIPRGHPLYVRQGLPFLRRPPPAPAHRRPQRPPRQLGVIMGSFIATNELVPGMLVTRLGIPGQPTLLITRVLEAEHQVPGRPALVFRIDGVL